MQTARDRRPPGASTGMTRGWLAAALILLLFAPLVWKRGGRGGWFEIAETPLDRPSPSGAQQWRFLSDTLAVVPPGASYTIFAPTPDEEMNLFMMSLGVCLGRRPLPHSYFGHVSSVYSDNAEYVLDFGCRTPLPSDHPVERVVQVRHGCVAKRKRSAASAPMVPPS